VSRVSSKATRRLGPSALFALIERNKARGKPVVNLTTRKTYPSVQAAADSVGALRSSIVQAIKRGGSCRYQRWAYAEKNGGAIEFPD
jgi:hypothetical protein